MNTPPPRTSGRASKVLLALKYVTSKVLLALKYGASKVLLALKCGASKVLLALKYKRVRRITPAHWWACGALTWKSAAAGAAALRMSPTPALRGQ